MRAAPNSCIVPRGHSHTGGTKEGGLEGTGGAAQGNEGGLLEARGGPIGHKESCPGE